MVRKQADKKFLSEIQKSKMKEPWDNKEDEFWDKIARELFMDEKGFVPIKEALERAKSKWLE